jgi:hypothetical protein
MICLAAIQAILVNQIWSWYISCQTGFTRCDPMFVGIGSIPASIQKNCTLRAGQVFLRPTFCSFDWAPVSPSVHQIWTFWLDLIKVCTFVARLVYLSSIRRS